MIDQCNAVLGRSYGRRSSLPRPLYPAKFDNLPLPNNFPSPFFPLNFPDPSTKAGMREGRKSFDRISFRVGINALGNLKEVGQKFDPLSVLRFLVEWPESGHI